MLLTFLGPQQICSGREQCRKGRLAYSFVAQFELGFELGFIAES